jgi:hypothetical protein
MRVLPMTAQPPFAFFLKRQVIRGAKAHEGNFFHFEIFAEARR